MHLPRGKPGRNLSPRVAGGVALVTGLVLELGTAGAQPSLPPHEGSSHLEAMVRMRQGREALARNDLDEAVNLLREAVALGAPVVALRDLAEVLERARRWREAAGAWTRYAALAPSDESRRAAMERRESLRVMLTPLRVTVRPAEAARHARLWIDRDPPRWYPAGGVEAVTPGGTHRVRVEATGWRVWERQVTTAFGEAAEVLVVLEREP